MKKRQKGFTLVELIVVIAIIAILASVAVVGYTQFIKKSKESKAQAELDQVYNVLYSQAVVNDLVLGSGGNTLTISVVNGKLKMVVAGTIDIKGLLTDYVGDAYDGVFAVVKATDGPPATPPYLTYTPAGGELAKRELAAGSE